MEYTLELTIGAAPDAVWAALADPGRWPDWQLGLTAVDDLAGTPGCPGAERELRFELPGNLMTMRETLAAQEPQRRYDAIYVSGPVWNLCENTLAPAGDGTRWEQRNSWRFEGVEATEDDRERFQATTLDGMQRLKRYVEDGVTVPRAG